MHNSKTITLKHCLVVLLLLSSGASTQLLADNYVIVGNTKNTVTEDEARQQIKRLYLKQHKRWSNGLQVTVFNRGDNSPEDRVFRDSVLDMSVENLSDHWMRLKQRNGGTPPRTITSTRTLLKLVSRYEGSFGVVNRGEAMKLPEGVRILMKIPN